MEIGTYSHGGIVYSVRNGERGMWDRGIVREVEQTYCWGRIDWSSVRFMMDVGAHIGSWSIQAANRAPMARIVSIEPLPENFILLAVNTHEKMMFVTTLFGAIYYTDRQLTLHVDTKNSGASEVLEDNDGIPLTKIWTLEQVCAAEGMRWIDVLKLDCEGSEHNILAQMSDGLIERTRYIVGEFHCTAEEFLAQHAVRMARTHSLDLIAHPDPSVKDLGMFFMEHKAWQPIASAF